MAKDAGILFDFGPPPRRVRCPIIDTHTHVGPIADTRTLVTAAARYGISGITGICDSASIRRLESSFPETFVFAVTLDYQQRSDPPAFAKANLKLIEDAAAAGARMVKFWCAPPFKVQYGIKLDDALLQPVFRRMAELRLGAIVHVADPDAWFATVYADAEKYGTKPQNFEQLENTVRRHPDVTFQGAHFAGDPEHLDHVGRLLDAYPNYFIDTSATKWISRELSRQPERAREFVIERADRILFGSDLTVWAGVSQRHCESRYWVHQMMWETDYHGPSPIHDPDGGGEVHIRGLHLPPNVLERIYYRNAARLGLCRETPQGG